MSEQYPFEIAFKEKMRQAGLSPAVVDTFTYYYRRLVDGDTGVIGDDTIRPLEPADVAHADDLASFAEVGRTGRNQVVRLVLNGGLGTSMGLTGPKSMVPVAGGRRFIDVIIDQSVRDQVQLAFMNSYNTDAATQAALDGAIDPDPICFLQNRYPKVLKSGFAPAEWSVNPDLEWNPPGHGDLFTAIADSGTLDRLLDQGIRYAFVHNCDNLGATVDDALLGYMMDTGIPFMMEVARRKPVDFKGGHLAVRLADGRTVLRESAQCPPDTLGTDVAVYQFFNTNTLWIDLRFLRGLIDSDQAIRLPVIRNPKTLDPRDSSSPTVFQIETAMGAAIELFEGARAVEVPRHRFLPVKKCNDLLVIRSDRYAFGDDHRLIAISDDAGDPPVIDLDPVYFGRIDDFDARFPGGAPSLKNCRSLTVRGDIRFEAGVSVVGTVVLTNTSGDPVVVPRDTVVDTDRQWP